MESTSANRTRQIHIGSELVSSESDQMKAAQALRRELEKSRRYQLQEAWSEGEVGVGVATAEHPPSESSSQEPLPEEAAYWETVLGELKVWWPLVLAVLIWGGVLLSATAFFGYWSGSGDTAELRTTIDSFESNEIKTWSSAFINMTWEESDSVARFYDLLANRMGEIGMGQFTDESESRLSSKLRENLLACQNLRAWVLENPKNLSVAERRWLEERCRAWSEGFEEDLREIAEQQGSASRVRASAASRVRLISEALATRIIVGEG